LLFLFWIKAGSLPQRVGFSIKKAPRGNSHQASCIYCLTGGKSGFIFTYYVSIFTLLVFRIAYVRGWGTKFAPHGTST
jgi:hypothetical protein